MLTACAESALSCRQRRLVRDQRAKPPQNLSGRFRKSFERTECS